GPARDPRAKVGSQPLAGQDDQREAMRFIHAFTALIGLLERPDTRQALAELRKVKNTTIGNLLGFMHAYNLRFGPATTPKERQAYQTLYETLDRTRDQILSEAKLESRATARSNPTHASDFFQNFGRRGTRQQAAPPPQPRSPQ